ncbi:MAG TPA: phosphoenolpyruvate synthase [Gemmatimonadales bacterium]|nr:phosphoenolpyruvate synthase [Gemmatimonadales bacterium]
MASPSTSIAPSSAGLERPASAPDYVIPFRRITLTDLPDVGGKNASLGELIAALGPAGVRVPDGFAVTAAAFRRHLAEAGLDRTIYEELDRLDVRNVAALAAAGHSIRERVAAAPLPRPVAEQLAAAYQALSSARSEESTDVAVRSSATAEDLPGASFAGQQETYLNVRGREALDRAVRSCFASLFTDRAIVYRVQNGFRHRDVALSVGVQQMVRSDLGSAGVIFTLDTETGFREVVLVTGAWGLGETVVQGRVRPDEFWVHKPTLNAGFRPILRREIAEKTVKLVYAEGGGKAVREVRVPADDRRRPVLDDDEVLALARWALAIEDHYSRQAGRPTPMDIEWARDGRTGELFIVQARPETVHSQRHRPTLELWRREGEGAVLVTGRSVGGGVASGPVRIVTDPRDLPAFRDGEVLVAPMTDPDWEPVLRRAAAVVTDEGGRTCHAAIVSRELGIPCVVGTVSATHALANGRSVTVSCAEGEEGRVYDGQVPFERTTVDPATLPTSSVPLMLNLANPDRAFQLAQLPSAGVGLVRIEFVISSWIGIHPMALVHPERVADAGTALEIRRRTAGAASGPEFFVERLASGVGQIAAAFYPRPVIVRFSDFKTNEYAGLLGGAAFEPTEANPMIGFRGASRYYDDRYREGFGLECAAIRRVREVMGLSNVKVMIPFCRTLEEGRRVLAELERHGLRRGERELEVYVMCEIPNNVVLGEEFAELFDGFSIGSNDLTQLALGVDRDSELLAHLFDERDPGVKRLIRMVVEAAHRKERKVGICGQAPSDYPDFAAFLAEIGIDSISLNPDSLPKVAERLHATAGS